MDIISKKEAKLSGLYLYFTGKFCKWGHCCERYVCNGHCIECHSKDTKNWNTKHPGRQKEITKEWRFLYPEQNQKLIDDWREKYPDKHRAYSRKSVSKHQKLHPGIYNDRVAKREAAKLHRTLPWADLEQIKTLYLEAALLTKEGGIKYDVDHIIPLQGEYVSGLHIESNLRVITHIDNMKKGNRFVVE